MHTRLTDPVISRSNYVQYTNHQTKPAWESCQRKRPSLFYIYKCRLAKPLSSNARFLNIPSSPNDRIRLAPVLPSSVSRDGPSGNVESSNLAYLNCQKKQQLPLPHTLRFYQSRFGNAEESVYYLIRIGSSVLRIKKEGFLIQSRTAPNKKIYLCR